MDRSRSPRVTNGQLSDEERFLQRLAAGSPDWQPTLTDIEISNERARELTAARAEIARLQAENARMRAVFNFLLSLDTADAPTTPPTRAQQAAPVTPPPVPFRGQGHRFEE